MPPAPDTPHACHRTAEPCACFPRVDTWIFDLDNTLYPSECNLFAQVDVRMGEFIERLLGIPRVEAKRLQKQFYYDHGTTLAGLMKVHHVEPQTFLDYVHDIDYAPVQDAPELKAALQRLPGRRLIFTNGSRRHAESVAARLGVLPLFDDIFDIADAAFVPKPKADAYHRFLAAHGIAEATSAMFEDLPQNLEVPHQLGMTTVLVHSAMSDHPIYAEIKRWPSPPAYIHHVTDDLAGFLAGL